MGLVSPAAQAMMTRLVPPDEQGRLQGAVASVLSVAGLIGPILFTSVYAAAVDVPGAPWFVAAALMLAGFAVTLAAARQHAAAG